MAERVEDFNLPNAVIARLVKEALPDGVNVSKEAKSVLTRAASVFSLYATSCANNFAMKAKRKTLTAADVLSAIEDMEFEKFLVPMNQSLEMFRREKANKSSKKKSSKTGDISMEIEEEIDDFKEGMIHDAAKVELNKSLETSEDMGNPFDTNEETNAT